MLKYRRLRERLLATGSLTAADLEVPPPATDEELLRVHEAAYLQRVIRGELERDEVRRLGFPWSPSLVERSRRSVGGTLAAARHALSDSRSPAMDGFRHRGAVNLAGGTHHAFADRGEGFCVFNDVAVAARAVQAEGLARRILIVDTDVHQGNGTAAIFAGDDSVFTLSIHGRKNYPAHKENSDLDVELEDGAGDREYLEQLDRALSAVAATGPVDLVFFLAGADPYRGDRLGRLALTKAGLQERDRRILAYCSHPGQGSGTGFADLDIPLVVVMAGGYAVNIDNIVDIHASTIESVFKREPD